MKERQPEEEGNKTKEWSKRAKQLAREREIGGGERGRKRESESLRATERCKKNNGRILQKREN